MIENKIKKKKEEIKKLERMQKIKALNSKSLERKKRARKLIQKGALLEIAEIINIDNEVLLGYFVEFKKIDHNKEQLIYLKEIGKKK